MSSAIITPNPHRCFLVSSHTSQRHSDTGTGVDDREAAQNWYSKAKRLNDHHAINRLGRLKITAVGPEAFTEDTRRQSEAFACFVESQANVPEAKHNLAMCYERGWGTKVDYKQACRLYRQAAEVGQDSGPLLSLAFDLLAFYLLSLSLSSS